MVRPWKLLEVWRRFLYFVPPRPNPDGDPHASTAWPVIFYFYPEDVAALYDRVRDRGFEPTLLKDTIYGMREFSLQDPDGHMLSFGQDSDEAERANRE